MARWKSTETVPQNLWTGEAAQRQRFLLACAKTLSSIIPSMAKTKTNKKYLWPLKTQFVGHNKQAVKWPGDEKEYLLNSILKRETEEGEEKEVRCIGF